MSTDKAKVRSVKCCILFDSADGTIRHVHRVVTMQGAQETPQDRIEARAMELARELGLDVRKLRPLHIDPLNIQPDKQYKVDPGKATLVASDLPAGPKFRPGRA